MPDTAEVKLGPLIGVMRALILVRPGGRNLVSAASGGVSRDGHLLPRLPSAISRRGWVGKKERAAPLPCCALCAQCRASLATQRSSVRSLWIHAGGSLAFRFRMCFRTFPSPARRFQSGPRRFQSLARRFQSLAPPSGLRPSPIYTIAVAIVWCLSLSSSPVTRQCITNL